MSAAAARVLVAAGGGAAAKNTALLAEAKALAGGDGARTDGATLAPVTGGAVRGTRVRPHERDHVAALQRDARPAEQPTLRPAAQPRSVVGMVLQLEPGRMAADAPEPGREVLVLLPADREVLPGRAPVARPHSVAPLAPECEGRTALHLHGGNTLAERLDAPPSGGSAPRRRENGWRERRRDLAEAVVVPPFVVARTGGDRRGRAATVHARQSAVH